jgi:hypothetical protein
MKRIISWGEVRLALRLIVKQPILSATIILALATGICLATMGFTFRDALLHSSLPYRAGERVARVFAFDREGRGADIDLERYRVLRDRAVSFEHVGLVREIGILPGHTPILAQLVGPSEVKVKSGTTEERFQIDGGFMSVKENKVIVLAEETAAP